MMTKQEFLEELNRQLQDIPEQERKEAVLYYEEYFDEAQITDTEDVLQKTDTPHNIARSIKAGLQNNERTGEFTERGYEDFQKSREELIRQGEMSGDNEGDFYKKEDTSEKKKLDTSKIILIIIAAVFTFPIWGGVVGGLIGVIIGIVAVIFGLAIAVASLTVSLLIAGIAVIIAGIIKLCITPGFGAVLAIGVGFLMFGIGMLALMFLVWACSELVPAAIRGFHWGIGKLKRKEV